MIVQDKYEPLEPIRILNFKKWIAILTKPLSEDEASIEITYEDFDGAESSCTVGVYRNEFVDKAIKNIGWQIQSQIWKGVKPKDLFVRMPEEAELKEVSENAKNDDRRSEKRA